MLLYFIFDGENETKREGLAAHRPPTQVYRLCHSRGEVIVKTFEGVDVQYTLLQVHVTLRGKHPSLQSSAVY